jgi:hypothetical protein
MRSQGEYVTTKSSSRVGHLIAKEVLFQRVANKLFNETVPVVQYLWLLLGGSSLRAWATDGGKAAVTVSVRSALAQSGDKSEVAGAPMELFNCAVLRAAL